MTTGATPGGALTRAQADRATRIHGLLGRGAAALALPEAQALVEQAPASADAHQALAMCLADVGRPDDADRAFDRAWSLAPDSEIVALNVAGWMRRRERRQQALALLASALRTARTARLRGLLHLECDAPAEARAAYEDALAIEPASAEAWHGLGNALRAMGALEEAESALARSVEVEPGYAPGWINRGAVLRSLGRLEPALACFRRAANLGRATPDSENATHGVLQDLGRPAEALSGARTLVHRHPQFVAGYESLSHLLWEHGGLLSPGEDPLAAFRDAALAQPGHRSMQLAFVRTLVQTRHLDEALSRLQALEQQTPGDPVFDWLTADVLDRMGDAAATGRFIAANRHLGARSTAFLNAYARHAFRIRRPDVAQDCAQRALGLDPNDQEAWGHLGIAWRLAGDAREHWLFDCERLVADLQIEAPPGYADLHGFLADLRTTLDAMHASAGQPMGQSVRNGSQTPGRLFGRDDPVLKAAESALRATVEAWLARLPVDAGHPFLRRNTGRIRIAGSWSIRLASSGRHANHIHDEGWMSSAFYVALPPSVQHPAGASTAGCLQLGQPMDELDLDLSPRRLVRPEPGRLVLFPSYLWHGTVPFDDATPRLTVAFDMQPAV